LLWLKRQQCSDRNAIRKDARTPYLLPINERLSCHLKQANKSRYPHQVANKIIALLDISHRCPTAFAVTSDVPTVIQEFIPGFYCERGKPVILSHLASLPDSPRPRPLQDKSAINRTMREVFCASPTDPRSFQDHDVSPRMMNGRSMERPAHRVASVTSVRPVIRSAPIARLRRAAMTLGPFRVLTLDLSSWYRVSRSQ
jgi:hypothetical protein